MKTCTKCGDPKEVGEFHRTARSKDGRTSICKRCVSEYHKVYHAKNKAKLVAKVDAWRESNSEHVKEWRRGDYQSHRTERLDYGHQRHKRRYSSHIDEYRARARSLPARFNGGRHSAKSRGLKWEILFDDWANLASNPCHYCGDKLSPAGYGLDRIDNTGDYRLGNVVPCCRDCNTTRMNTYTYEEMLLLAKTIRLIKKMRQHVD